MNKKNLSSHLLLILTFCWIIISLTRTVNNFSKIITEERSWYFLTDDQKRAKQFGDTYYFLRFVQNNTKKNSNILFFTNDLKTYYFGRYYLYPTKIIGEHEPHIWKPRAEYYDYILIYPVNKTLVHEANTQSNIAIYKKTATFRSASGTLGILYKK